MLATWCLQFLVLLLTASLLFSSSKHPHPLTNQIYFTSMSESALSREQLADLKIKLSKLAVDVTVTDVQSDHPHYKLQVKDTKTLMSYIVDHRFHIFRDLKKKLDADDNSAIATSFPKTYAKSQLGFRLSEKQAEERVLGLHDWIQDILSKLHLLTPSTVQAVSVFVNLEQLEREGAEAAVAAKKIEALYTKKMEAKRAAEAAAAAKAGDVKVNVTSPKKFQLGDDNVAPAAAGCGCTIS